MSTTRINDHVFLIESMRGKGANVYVVLDHETTIIDTGMPGSLSTIRQGLAELGVDLAQVKQILITHGDIDHIGNAAQLQELSGAALWASPEDIPSIMGRADRKGFKKFLKYVFRVAKPRQISPLMPGQPIGAIEVIATPGHTPGHVCFRYGDVLFAGDLLQSRKGRLIPFPAGWDWDHTLALQSIGRIARLPVQWVCPGHGAPVEKGSLLADFVD
jgi:glyoxylase-like metal-dependent hydrolase (beta-lactamase superfamily II)